MLEYFLMIGTCYAKDFTYTVPNKKLIGIDWDDAVRQYEDMLRQNCLYLKDEGYEFSLSGGLDSSIMFALAAPDRAFCCQVDGNRDYGYAKRFYPDVIKESSFMHIPMETQLIENQKLWDIPHCRRADFYDYHIYHQYDKVAVGEHPNYCNYLHYLKRGKSSRLKLFLDWCQIFTPDEIREFGYEPPVIKLEREAFDDFMAFVEDWTKLTRKIFYKFRGKVESPFLMDNTLNFFKQLPIELKTNKNIIREVGKRNLPEFINIRRKDTRVYKQFNPTYAAYRKVELDALKKKYLMNPEIEIFNHLPYEVVRKHMIKDFRKCWNLLNLAIWYEVHK